jgi:MFS family permease
MPENPRKKHVAADHRHFTYPKGRLSRMVTSFRSLLLEPEYMVNLFEIHFDRVYEVGPLLLTMRYHLRGLMNAFGVFQTYYQLDLLASKSASDISWIGSTQSFLMFVVSIVAGPVVDAGYLLPLLGIGSLLTVFGMFMTSICSEYWQVLLAQAITMGLGFGCLYVPAPTIVSQYFDANTALAMGASSAGSALGMCSFI